MLGVGDVGRVGEHPPPARLDIDSDRDESVGPSSGENDVGAHFGECHGEPPAKARGSPGDDGGLAVEEETIQNGHGDSPLTVDRRTIGDTERRQIDFRLS